MTTRIRSTLNQNALGPGLVLSQGGLVVTTTQDALSDARKVLGTIPRAIGDSGFECQFWSTTRPSLLPVGNRVGFAVPTSSLTACVGADADSWGYEPATGSLYNNGSAVATGDLCQERRVITIFAAWTTTLSIGVAIDGTFQFLYDTGAMSRVVPAVTVCGSNAADISVFVNFGQTPMNYPQIQVAA